MRPPVRRTEAAVEKLVLPERQRLVPLVLAGEDEGNVSVAADRGVDPIPSRRGDALEERAD
jgi:hypothetical protein